MFESPASERECGSRQAGGVYIEVGLGDGAPIESFYIDPPIPVPDGLVLSARGINIVQLRPDGPFHAIDVIGMDNYPNVADILEEGKRLGFSRRIQRTAEFAKLGRESRLIFVHARGFVANFPDYYQALERANGNDRYQNWWWCPRRLTTHLNLGRPETMCAGLWWCDLADGIEPVESEPGTARLWAGLPVVKRTMSHMDYRGAARPEGIEPKYQAAFIANFPISRLAVIAAEDGSHERAVRSASASGLQVDVLEA